MIDLSLAIGSSYVRPLTVRALAEITDLLRLIRYERQRHWLFFHDIIRVVWYQLCVHDY